MSREDTMILELATRAMEMALDGGVELPPEQAIEIVARTLGTINDALNEAPAAGGRGAGSTRR